MANDRITGLRRREADDGVAAGRIDVGQHRDDVLSGPPSGIAGALPRRGIGLEQGPRENRCVPRVSIFLGKERVDQHALAGDAGDELGTLDGPGAAERGESGDYASAFHLSSAGSAGVSL